MRSSLITALALFLTLSIESRGQSFELAAATERQGFPPGSDATFIINVVPKSGYSATVNFRASTPTLPWVALKVPETQLNAPYTGGFSVIIDAKSGHLPGVHPIIVEGWNGPLKVVDTCWLDVKPTRGWHHYSTANSPLPNNQILNIIVDKTGTGWIATPAGITRFDKTNWMSWSTDTLGGTLTGAMALDSSGALWVALNNGLAKYADGAWTRHLVSQTSQLQRIQSLAVDKNNKLWMSVNDMLAELDGTGLKQHPADIKVKSLAIDHSGVVWTYAQGHGEGLSKFDGMFWSYNVVPLSFGAAFVMFDRDGLMWLVSQGSVGTYDGVEITGRGARSGIFPGRHISCLAIDAGGDFWSGSGGGDQFSWGEGMIRFDGVTSTHFTPYNSGLPDQRVNLIAPDPDGSLWLRTNAGGFEIFHPAIASGVAAPKGDAVASSMMSLFPNPASDGATVRLNLSSREHARISIHDPLGRELRVALEETVDSGEMLVTIDARDLPSGQYFIRLTAGAVAETRPLTIVR